MIEEDTIKLLRECDAGIKMGVASIDETLQSVKSEDLKKYLEQCKAKHEGLKEEIQVLLEKYHDEGNEPGAMAKGMSWIKTNAKLAMDESDKTVADLMTDGCNMGIKTLNRYLNQYEAADEKSKDIAKRLIKLEEKLVEEIRQFFSCVTQTYRRPVWALVRILRGVTVWVCARPVLVLFTVMRIWRFCSMAVRMGRRISSSRVWIR